MTMSNQYDVIMIGAGPSAIFCAYELKRNKPDMKVLMIVIIQIISKIMF